MTRMELGQGELNWHPSERVSDRYGSVFLAGGTLEDHDLNNLEGTLGTLVAEVIGTRQAGHPGDWFHHISPETPALGEEIVLGTGHCFSLPPVDDGSSAQVGLVPADGREELWLDLRALYRAQGQMVRLWFRPQIPGSKKLLSPAIKSSGLTMGPDDDFLVIVDEDAVPGRVSCQVKRIRKL